MNNEVFRDKRLLGALDYIDERFIAEVTESYTFEAPGEYKRDKKTAFRVYRRLAVLAACLVLISAVFPIVNYVLPRFGVTFGGNAGAGTSELETPPPIQTEALETEPEVTEAEIIDSGFDKYLEAFADMSAEEIYAEVLKGGWVVSHNGDLNDETLWNEFVDKVANNEVNKIFVAEYYNDTLPSIFLREINFDGAVFDVEVRYIGPDKKEDKNYTKTLHFLVEKEIINTNGAKTVWALVDDPKVTYYEWLLSVSSSNVSKHIPWESLFYLY